LVTEVVARLNDYEIKVVKLQGEVESRDVVYDGPDLSVAF
jgi:hypothetical protein